MVFQSVVVVVVVVALVLVVVVVVAAVVVAVVDVLAQRPLLINTVCIGLRPSDPLKRNARSWPFLLSCALSGVLRTNGGFSSPAMNFTSTPPPLWATT